MKSSLGKLRRFALSKSDTKEKDRHLFSAHLDELSQASLDMQDMRNCYDSLLSAAAATENSAYEFSESLRDMGTCLLEKTALDNDGESGGVLSNLGKVQLELQKLVDSYRSHVVLTITTPSESLLTELRTVEEMKRQCDEKRKLYEHMLAQQREKVRSKSGKGESFTPQQLQAARDAFDEEATLCVFRLKSLKQGQWRSLLTQAARHHAAQLNLFRKGLKSLEAVEPQIRLVTQKHHIDYQLSGLDDGEDVDEEVVNCYEMNNDGELTFDYRTNKQGLDVVSMSRNSMELDEVDLPRPQASTVEDAEINVNLGDHVVSREARAGSHSAPIFPDKKFDPAERIREMQSSAGRKFHSYVLPTPVDAKSPIPSRPSSSIPSRPTNISGGSQNLWHSSPLEPEKQKHDRDTTDSSSSLPTTSKAQSAFRESTNDKLSVQLPPRLADGLSLLQNDTHNPYDAKKIKRQAFSGPLTSKPHSTKPVLSASGPINPTELPQLVSGLHSRGPIHRPTSSPKVSPSASPPLASSPKISELHELPRPPASLASKPSTSSGISGHSAPLVFRNQETSSTKKTLIIASPLPAPPLTVPRSFSIPSSNQRAMAVHVANLLETQVPERTEEIASPPLTPISLLNTKQLSTVSGQMRGGS